MRWLLIGGIKAYRCSAGRVPRQRTCLYRVTCSRHTENVARRDGLRAGLAAMRARLRSCRPGYHFIFEHDNVVVVCVDGSQFSVDDASTAVVGEATRLQQSVSVLRPQR